MAGCYRHTPAGILVEGTRGVGNNERGRSNRCPESLAGRSTEAKNRSLELSLCCLSCPGPLVALAFRVHPSHHRWVVWDLACCHERHAAGAGSFRRCSGLNRQLNSPDAPTLADGIN